MDIQVIEAETKKHRKAFVRFPMDLYRECPYYVPPLIQDELDTFDPVKNPAYDTAESKLFLAYKDGKLAGRVAAILSHIANETFGTKNMRFGWFDCIEDYAVAEALFDAVVAWARETGLETIVGPQGFCNFDRNGMLTEGFDKLSTFAVYYNYPYYNDFVMRYGFAPKSEYVEYRSETPADGVLPERLTRVAEKVRERGHFRLLALRNRKQVMELAPQIFALMAEAYEELPDVVPFSERQKTYYTKRYLSFVNPDLITVAVDRHGEVAGFILALPDLSVAFRRAKGRLFPFGIFHLLRAMRKNDTLDFALAGVRKKHRGRGVDVLMAVALFNKVLSLGFKYAESNPEWDRNPRIQAEWKPFSPVLHKRRRTYKLVLSD